FWQDRRIQSVRDERLQECRSGPMRAANEDQLHCEISGTSPDTTNVGDSAPRRERSSDPRNVAPFKWSAKKGKPRLGCRGSMFGSRFKLGEPTPLSEGT